MTDVVAEWQAGRLSTPVALMRLALAGQPVPPPLAQAAAQHAKGLALLRRMVAEGAHHAAAPSEEAGIAESRALFDRLVALSPEASVAAYSLGDPALLAEATAELLAWLRGQGLLELRPAVLDLGCGIGRLTAALAPFCARVVGLDVSPGMVAAARAHHPALAFLQGSGRDLHPLEDGSFDLVLACDVFPYLVQAGLPLAERHVAEAARVLRPGGSLLILNFSYGAGAEALPAMAARHGFTLRLSGARPFQLWDAAVWWLRLIRPAEMADS